MVNCVFISILNSSWVHKAVLLFASEDSIFIWFKEPSPEELLSWSKSEFIYVCLCIYVEYI